MFGMNVKSRHSYKGNEVETLVKDSYCAGCKIPMEYVPPSRGVQRCWACLHPVEKQKDDINNPQHYTQGKIEVIDFIEDQKLNYHLSNVIKYICRAPHKGTYLKDLKKAQWYLNRWIELSEDLENSNEAEKRGG